jgi:hypothetical protein
VTAAEVAASAEPGVHVVTRFHAEVRPTEFVPFGPTLVLPASYTFTAEGYPIGVSAVVEVDEEGPHLASVTMTQLPGGPPVTTDTVRAVPLAKLLRTSAACAVWEPRQLQGAGELRQKVDASRRRWRMTDDHLRRVADVYRDNPRDAAGRRAPVNAVMEQFGTTRPTAGRWVMKARKRGFLPPATDSGGKLPPVKRARKQ